jgi:hypothetical protein
MILFIEVGGYQHLFIVLKTDHLWYIDIEDIFIRLKRRKEMNDERCFKQFGSATSILLF